MRIESLLIYPIKSCGAVELHSTRVYEYGFEFDREWMLIDQEGTFISQREYPLLNLIKVLHVDHDQLQFDFQGQKVAFELRSEPLDTLVKVWSSECMANRENPIASEFFSDLLQSKVSLVRIKRKSRLKKNEYLPKTIELNFPDGYPVHLVNQHSVETVSSKAGDEIFPIQFRPNILIKDLLPFEEDQLKMIKINSLEFTTIKTCVRCIMTTLKPMEAKFQKEPLSTLSKFRKNNNNIEFGIYLLPRLGNESMTISISDPISYL